MKTYIGDGVYAEFDQYGDLVLTTENGISTTNRIVLEGRVLRSLLRWMKENSEANKREANSNTPA